MAFWCFCHPSKIQDLQTLIGKSFKTEVKLSIDEWKRSQTSLGFDDAGRPWLELKFQKSGEIINVPPGWAHSVINLRVSLF